MKLNRLILSFLAIFGVMLFTSCENTPKDVVESGETSLTFETTDIELDGKGGTYSLGYTLAYGIEGIDIAYECDSEWLTNLRTEDSKLIFDYAQNLGNKERVASIMVTYPNLKSTMLKVRQRINDSVTFAMEVTSNSTTSCKTVITPSDPETTYIVYMAEVAYLLGAQISTTEDLFNDDYNYFMGFAEQVNAPKLKEFMLMNYFAYQDVATIEWEGMMPNSEYVLYVYAIEFNEENTDYYLASPITYQMVTLEGPELDTVEFDVTVDVNGPEATYHIDPMSWEGKYYLSIYEEGDYMYRDANNPVDEDFAELVSDVWIDMMNQLVMSGYTSEQLLQLMCLEGYEEYSETLKGDTNYALVIFAVGLVDNLPQVISVPQVFNFRTEEIGESAMKIDIKVENKYVRVADITLTPSTNEPYTAAILAKSQVPDMSDEEIIAWLNRNIYMDTYTGEVKSHLNTLQPETEYSILAYGYWGDVVTTDLFRIDFKTDAAGVCENSVIRVDFNGPYSLKELEAYDSYYYYNYGMFEDMGWYAMWGEIFTEEPTQDLFYCIYSATEFATYGEQAVFNDLVEYTCNKTSLFTGKNDTLYLMCAVAMDYRGNYSEMWVSEPFMYTYSAATKRPLEELIEKIYGTSATTSAQRKSVTKSGITNLLAK